MCLANRQAGFSKLGLIALLAVAGFFLLCAFRLAPAYLDDRYIQQALRSLGDGVDNPNEMSDRDIRKKIDAFFAVNNVRTKSAKDLEIIREDDRTLVYMDYEVRVPLIYNIDVVMSFNNVWDSARPRECCKLESEE